MKISVVIASYNGASYIAGQLKSILEQSTVPHEIIISDDSSTDSTEEIVKEFARNAPQTEIIFVNNPPPHGVDRNFENALRLASGDVIFLCDQDDVWLPERVEVMMRIFKSGTPGATFCDSRIVDENLQELGYTHIQSRGFQNFEEIFSPDSTAFLKRVPPAGHDMAFSREFLDILLPFPDLKDCYDTWIGLVLYALGAWKISSPLPLTLFRRHSSSVTRSGIMPSFAESLRQARDAVKNDTSGWYAQLYGELIERIGEKITPEMREKLENRRSHSIVRSRMNTTLWRRVKLVIQETVNGNYFRFGRSYKNIIQDIFLRHP